MKPKTEQALRESIAKWQKNAEITDWKRARTSAEDCPLCLLFYSDIDMSADCIECPVYEATRKKHCNETPYHKARKAEIYGDLPAFRAASKREVEFLESLLPGANA